MRPRSPVYCGSLAAILAAMAAVALGLAAPAPAAVPGAAIGGGGITLPPPRNFAMRTTDGPVHLTDAAQAVAAFDQDTLYTAGFFTESLSGSVEQHRWLIRKVRPNGVLVWSANSPFLGEANSVAVRSDGSVVVAGLSNRAGAGSTPTFAVAKWDVNGVHQWTREIAAVDQNGAPRWVGEAREVALTSNGDVAVVGILNNLLPGNPPDNDQDAVVVLLNGSTGSELWRRVIEGTDPDGNDNGTAVAVDLQDRIIAVGSMRNNSSNKDIFVVSFSSSGQPLFGAPLNIRGNIVPGDDEATEVAIDGQGQIYVSGYRTNAGFFGDQKDFWVGKFASNGSTLFQRDLAGNVEGEDRGLAVGFDATGNLYASGFTTNTYSPGSPQPPAAAVASADFTVAKWDAFSGALLWTQKTDGGVNGDDRARSIAVRSNGDLVDGGHLSRTAITTNPTPRDFALMRHSTAGVKSTDFRHDGTAHNDDSCAAVAFDGGGWGVGVGVTRNNGNPLLPPFPTGADFSVAN